MAIYTHAKPKRGKALQVYEYLVAEPKFRERHNKDRGIVNLLLKEHPSIRNIPKDVLIEIVQKYDTMNRAWRDILEDNRNAHLRGKDYPTKRTLQNNNLTKAQRYER